MNKTPLNHNFNPDYTDYPQYFYNVENDSPTCSSDILYKNFKANNIGQKRNWHTINYNFKKLKRICVSVAILFFVSGTILLLSKGAQTKSPVTEQTFEVAGINEEIKKPAEIIKEETLINTELPNKLELKTMWFGDVFWGRYVNDWSEASNLQEKYPFSGLNTLNREQYDAWMANLDCPITDQDIDSKKQNSTLEFNCTPNYLVEAKNWFSSFNLANSHANNMDKVDGSNLTRKYLTENSIQYFGHHDKDQLNDICQVNSFKANGGVEQKIYLPIAICGFHNTFSLPTDAQLAQISKYSQNYPTVVYGIQGGEYNTESDGLQKQYFRKMIDLGADAVIGKGAHVVQETEVYKDKLIVYSMGNLIFDQQNGANVTQGLGVEANFEFEVDDNLQKILSFSKECSLPKNDCLEKAKDLEKPKFKINYDLIATDNSQKLAKKGNDTVQKNILKRTKWSENKAKLEAIKKNN